jgi:hypothetical protein
MLTLISVSKVQRGRLQSITLTKLYIVLILCLSVAGHCSKTCQVLQISQHVQLLLLYTPSIDMDVLELEQYAQLLQTGHR